MKREIIRELYFLWIYHKVMDGIRGDKVYKKLLRFLHDRYFSSAIPMDTNREEDGYDLRFRFAYEEKIDARVVSSEIDDRPCSILEMMAALAIRMDEQIMAEPDKNDRTGKWFFEMLNNLGLVGMDDNNFSLAKAKRIIDRFLDHDYSHDGKGGLFYIPKSERDMRTAEIWYQMNWYINYKMEKENDDYV